MVLRLNFRSGFKPYSPESMHDYYLVISLTYRVKAPFHLRKSARAHLIQLVEPWLRQTHLEVAPVSWTVSASS